MIPHSVRLTTAILFLFALSFTFFAIQSGDTLMYLTLVRDYLARGEWPLRDPYIYSRPNADLQIAHEYLSYFVFYGAWWLGGWGGLIVLKALLLAALFAVTLRAQPRERNSSPLWMGLWLLAVFAASFRFIERSSLFSDLFSVLLLSWLVNENKITRALIVKLTILFALWVQLHPGFPLGVLCLAVWTAWNLGKTKGFAGGKLAWLLLPLLALAANPLFVEGALYPFRFALNEARVLKLHNFEWFPTYHPAFRFAPETIGFWGLVIAAAFLLWRERAWFTLRGVFALLVVAVGVSAVRFVPWTSFALVLLLKPWSRLERLRMRYLWNALVVLMLAIAVKNFGWGYQSSSGPRRPKAELDRAFFPVETVAFLKSHPLDGTLYNAHDFGSYLLWEGVHPIFHHGFVTDMEFYEQDVVGVFQGQARFLELARKYGWTKLLVDKHGSYPYFYRILSPLPQWRIVAEDEASYLIYLLP